MKDPKEMIKFFAVNQKVGKRIKEGKMVTVDYPFKYTQKDLDAVREAVIAEVLEIIESVSDDWLEDNCEWDWHGEMKSRVLSLRGEQE